MKILIVSQYYYPEPSVVTKIAEGLSHRGHAVSVLTGKPNFKLGYIMPGYKNISYELINGIKVHRVNVKPIKKSKASIIKNYYSFFRNSCKWIKNTKEKYDIVLSIGLGSIGCLAAGNIYKKMHKVPHVAYVMDVWPDGPAAKRDTMKHSPFFFLFYPSSRRFYKKADQLILGSPIYEEYFKKVLRLKKKEYSFIPRAALLEEGVLNPYPYKSGFNIVYIGPIDEMHMLDMIPEAMQKVANPNVYFHIYGSGKLAGELLNKINSLGLHEKVILHGEKPLDETENNLALADACYLSMSTRHNTGLAISDEFITMMAYKKPIIAMVQGDQEDVLKETGGGFLLGKNVDDLVFTISKVASMKKEVLKEKGNRNYDYFMKHYNLPIIIGEIESVLLKKSL